MSQQDADPHRFSDALRSLARSLGAADWQLASRPTGEKNTG